MQGHPSHELPIRSKIEMARDIAHLIHCLGTGQRAAADLLIEDLKTRSLFLEDPIQSDVLVFVGKVQFQEAYDPWHCVNLEIQQAADKLIESLGFVPPHEGQ